MTAFTLIFAIVGAIMPLIVIVQALRSSAQDRWPEGVLVGIYLGVLGSISVIALLALFGD
jgi:NADH:ubiquinone oxidoreductase subunit 6 (subunit J)